VLCGMPQTKLAMRRDKLKIKRLAASRKFCHHLCIHSRGFFLSTRPVFYSGTCSTRTLPNPIPNGIMLSAMEDLRVIVDTTSGARMESATGNTVFILIPCHDAINKMTHITRMVASQYYALDKVKHQPKCQKRLGPQLPKAMGSTRPSV
jgi:hypothetical protein